MRGGEGGGFGRAVAIDQRDAGQRSISAQHMWYRERLATGQQFLKAREVTGVVIDDGVEQRGRQPGAGDLVPANGLRQSRSGGQDFVVHHATPPIEEGAPDLERGGVEAQRRCLQEHRARIQTEISRFLYQPQDGGMRNLGALGRAGGARGVHDIGDGVGVGIFRRSFASRREMLEQERAHPGRQDIRSHLLVRQQQGRAAVLHHETQPDRGVCLVER